MILGYKNNDTIWVGADSRATYPIGKDKKGNTVYEYIDTVCKIFNYKNYNFAISGGFANFIVPLGLRFCNKYNELYNLIPSFGDTLINQISIFLDSLKNSDTLTFNSIISEASKKEGNLSHVLFFGFYEGHPYFYKFDLNVLFNGMDYDVSWQQHEGLVKMICTGHCDSSYKYWSNIEFWKGIKIEYGIKAAIQFEEASDKFVGGKIDIIMITKDSIQWIERKKVCCTQ